MKGSHDDRLGGAYQHGGPLACGARWQGGDLLLTVRVVPRASTDHVSPQADCLKVRLTAPPVEGKANQHLCRVLGKLFGVPKSRVLVEKGTAGRTKQVRIVEPREVPPLLRP